jgi:transcriptional regulator with XRE-family HTH domain
MAKRRELTESEKLAVERLKKIWAVKKNELKLTQEAVGLACGWSGQVAFAQYINGNVPLNVEAVLRIAKVFKVHPAEIMPEIQDLLPEVRGEATAATAVEQDVIALARLILELPAEQRVALRGVANAFLNPTSEQTEKTEKRKLDTGHTPERRKKSM